MSRHDWRSEGSDPDVRFSLANERTFLEWVRTSLALLAGGVALPQFLSTPRAPWWSGAIAGVPMAVATWMAGEAYRHWRANEIAMRHDRPLPATPAIPLRAVVATAVGVGFRVASLCLT